MATQTVTSRVLLGRFRMVWQIMAALALCVLPLLIFGGVIWQQVRHALDTEVKQSLTHQMDRAEGQLNFFIEKHLQVLRTAAALPAQSNMELPRQLASLLAVEAANKDFRSLSVYGLDGIALTRTHPTPGSKPKPLKDRPYFQAILRGAPYATQTVNSRTTGKALMILAAPILHEGHLVGILSGSFNLPVVSDYVQGFKVGKTGFAWLVDQENKVIAYPDAAMVEQRASLADHPVIKRARANNFKPDVVTQKGKSWLATQRVTAQGWVLVVQLEASEAFAATRQFESMMAIAGIVSLLIVGILGLLISRSLSRPIQWMAAYVSRMAQGEFNQEVQKELTDGRQDEIGEMARSLQAMSQQLRTVIGQVRSAAASVASGASQISDNSEQMFRAAQVQVAAIEETSGAMQEMSASIQQVAGNTVALSENVEETSSSIEEMAASIKQVAGNSDVLASATSDTSAAIEQVVASIQQVALNVTKTSQVADLAAQEAKGGQAAVEQTIAGMAQINQEMAEVVRVINGLGQSTAQIGNIVDVIDDIAEQTNLLALNAAIEAARAGEHGRGFAVVADEVRKLAERSAKATGEIAKLIRGIQQESSQAVNSTKRGEQAIQDGTQLAQKAGTSLQAIVGSVGQVSNLMGQIANATQEQDRAAGQITQAVINMSTLTQKVTLATNEQAKGSEQIIRAVESMNRMTHQVSLATTQQKQGGERVQESIERINHSAHETTQSAELVAESAMDLQQQAKTLVEAIAYFKDGQEAPQVTIVKETTVPRLASVAGRN